MIIIRSAVPAPANATAPISIVADRLVLAKRRWRAVAGDGEEFGFDLERPLQHGEFFWSDDERAYRVLQGPEPVLEIPTAGSDAAAMAKLGWMIGNLHFGIEISPKAVRVADDEAVRQMLQREGVRFQERRAVFQPLRAAAHHHEHAH